MPYELKLEKFSGPLDKLLELIENQKLGINEISLARVTDDFLRHLRSLSESQTDIRLIADFISVASRLILIKSKYLLPDLTLTTEEEGEIKDLERRLKLYREIKPIMKIVALLWKNKNAEFGRPYFMELGGATRAGFFYPGTNLELRAIVASLTKLFEGLRVFELETGAIKEKIISIEEKISEIIKRLERDKEMMFGHISRDKTRKEIIAIFLAILHLAKEQLIFLEQAGHLSDIIIRKQRANSK